MKKRMFIFSTLVLAAFSLSAQIQVGVRSGVSFANVRQTEVLESITPDLHDVVGATVSGFAEYIVSPAFSLQAELGYTRKGFGLALGTDVDLFGVNLPIGADAASRFNYLELPILAKGKFGSGAVQAVVEAGPALSYATGGRLVTKSTGLLELDLTNTKIDLDALGMQRWDISAVVGGGVEFKTGFGKLFLDGRYTHGFQEIYDIPLVREKAHNRGFSVGAGVAIAL